MGNGVSRTSGSDSSTSGSSSFRSDFGGGSADFESVAQKLQDPSSGISQAVKGLDPNNSLVKGLNVQDGIDSSEAGTITERLREQQASGPGNLDGKTNQLSLDEFLKAFGLDGQDRPTEAGETQPEGEGGAGKPGESGKSGGESGSSSGKASQDWNGDGKIDETDAQIEEMLKKVAESSGKSIEEVAQEFGGEDGKINESGEMQKLEEAAGGQGSQGDQTGQSSGNGLDDLIGSFGNSDNMFSQAA